MSVQGRKYKTEKNHVPQPSVNQGLLWETITTNGAQQHFLLMLNHSFIRKIAGYEEMVKGSPFLNI